MKVGQQHYRSIARAPDGWAVEVVDQTRLPHLFQVGRLESLQDAVVAIREMQVRGAPLIGVTAAYGICLAMHEDPTDESLARAYDALLHTRPTAKNLTWALDRMLHALEPLAAGDRETRAYELADAIADEDVAICEAIGQFGLPILHASWERRGGNGSVNVLTHCNAGWLAAVDWGTALAPIFKAHEDGIPLHVWVDETRPRNQGASLTAWELLSHGIDHTVIVDNAGGHLMQTGHVDLVITGTDRTTARGGVFNKIGTYLKALAAADNEIPFYVALPSPTIDWAVDEHGKVEIEERSGAEVSDVAGRAPDGSIASVRVTPEGSPVANPAFDYTPPHLVTGLITERGVCAASREGLLGLFPEMTDRAANPEPVSER